MKFITLAVTALSLSLLTANSYASQTGYEVELIIYEDATKRYIDSEDWSYNDMLNQSNNAVRNEDSFEPDAQFSELEWDGAVLSDALQRIQENPGLNVLVTKRWRQTGLNRDEAYPVEILSDTTEILDHTNNKSTLINEVNVEKQSTVPATTDVTQLPTSSIKGYVKLVMSRYLHFEVSLKYFKLQSGENAGYTYKSFPVVSERRMRSKEVHYIDHPMVGIIMLANPYKIESEQSNNQP